MPENDAYVNEKRCTCRDNWSSYRRCPLHIWVRVAGEWMRYDRSALHQSKGN